MIKRSAFLIPLLFAAGSSLVFSAPKKQSDSDKVKVVEVVSDEGAFQSKSVEKQVGNVKVSLKGGVGSFQLYTINRDKVAVPVLSGYDESTSSFFALRAGKKDYKLIDNAGVITGTRKSQRGVQIVYVVPGVARLFVKFDAFRSDPSRGEDIVKVTCVVRNRSGHEDEFALKNVLDTVLGEQRGSHFSTAQDMAINNEMQFRKMEKIRWIKSENNKASMQILLSGANITPPEVVSLANKDLVSLSAWVPTVVRSRSFDSVVSYNNSAVCLNWETVTLQPDEEKTYVYYIAFGNDGRAPSGDEFIEELERQIRLKGEEKRYSIKEFEDLYQTALSYAKVGDYEKAFDVVMRLWQNPENRNSRLESLKNYIESQVDASSAEKFESQIENLSSLSELNKVPETEKNDSFNVGNGSYDSSASSSSSGTENGAGAGTSYGAGIGSGSSSGLGAGSGAYGSSTGSDSQDSSEFISGQNVQTKTNGNGTSANGAGNGSENTSGNASGSGDDLYREQSKLPPRDNSDVEPPEFNPEELPKEKLNFGYVQGLIDRIYSLESEDDLDRTELIRLNAELDAIMKKLREM